MAADPSKLSYFSLPGEIRNKIMDLVLVHGIVHPYRPVSESSTRIPDPKAKIAPQSGIQLLATCRKAYEEGHALFYGSNTFHLPPIMTFDWADSLQAKHKDMIKRVSTTLGLDELTADMISQIERNGPHPAGIMDRRIPTPVQAMLDKIWETKMGKIAAWTSLQELELRSYNRMVVLQHHDIVAAMNKKMSACHESQYPGYSDPCYPTTRWPRICVWASLFLLVHRVDWKGTVEWLSTRKQDEVAEGLWHFLSRVSQTTIGAWDEIGNL